MTEVYSPDYEVSSEGGVRHWEIPYARLEDATPTISNPAEVLGTDGSQLTGTILVVNAATSVAIIDFTPSMVYHQKVRTVTTYAQAAESAWATLDVGDPVYYDNSATMPPGVYLSLAAANAAAEANTLFGWIVPHSDADAALFPLAAGNAGNTWDVAVMQHGA